MLKFLHLSAALAAVLTTQIPSSLLATQADAANQGVQANTHKLVVTSTLNARTEFTNTKPAILVTDSSNNIPEVAEKLGSTRIILGIAAVGGGVAVVLSAKKAENHFKLSSAPAHSSLRLSPESKENTIRLDQASRELQKKLLRLLHDDQDAANRLLNQVKMKNPDKSINWCVEKVVYDLERDRA